MGNSQITQSWLMEKWRPHAEMHSGVMCRGRAAYLPLHPPVPELLLYSNTGVGAQTWDFLLELSLAIISISSVGVYSLLMNDS